ncbi:DEAD/DEAH box helicase family protein [Microbacterium sp. APC 3898]|uniref:DEAD/DEAH box helicase family protein n=1 Tax=Planococcus notacanthi TaxID=3035188 RepID=A0ABT7ZFG4_9BACL|nr:MULTISPECIES: DEAD/DEAH box helicase [Terrabacteria group]MDN3425898.1 DEAD/DEAH box helicase family protein [Planococcus sp. APC 4016]MDN3497596.1 DEAD/DEAH box helicase family protein [Microbacterium sp. APC 3898]
MKDIEEFLTGRVWLRNFTPFPKEQIDQAILNGKISISRGITDELQCARCLEKSPQKIISFFCSACVGICYYCRHCIRMGRVSSCTELITWSSPSTITPQSHSFHWNGNLTPLQERASQEVQKSLFQQNDHLVYAVCGAGKTELLFPPIFAALQKGQRVCVAAPRTDVVLELSPRLRAVFPDTIIHSLYGNSPEESGFASLVIATTHQLYRFQNAFDVMIVDEADAFPYSYDLALKNAVIKARKKDAPIVYVSATPSDQLQKQVPEISQIFQRFHGHPLPVPEFRSLWGYDKAFAKGKIPKKLIAWVDEKIEKEEPFLVFFPTIEMIEQAIPLLQERHPEIAAVHSKDPDRKEKVMKLRQRQIPGVLTSTILERGITIPNVQVAVVGADQPVFNAAALIQIAGRAGRSADYPDGEVVFFHNGIVRQMDKAKQLIISYNGGSRR